MNRRLKRLFEIEIFAVTFDQFNASLMNKSVVYLLLFDHLYKVP